MISLRLRLYRALLISLILGAWAIPKLAWEEQIAREQNELRYHGISVSPGLREQLGQGLFIGLLSGLRAVVADVVWLEAVNDWMDYRWFRLAENVHLCTTLQPRSVIYWRDGGAYLAWDAAYGSLRLVAVEPDLYRRQRAFLFWREQGRQLLISGLQYNPGSYELWTRLASLYQQDGNFREAALSYDHAARCPGAPIYLERFPGAMYEKAQDWPDAYAAWRGLWLRLTPEQKADPQHWPEKIIEHLKMLESKLNLPPDQRLFP